MKNMQQTRYLLIPLLLIVYTTPTLAEVVLDGTLGPAIELDGPDFDIAAELGQQHGGNLFHSFKWFNLDKEETATFSGPNTVENIIGRVTGGKSFVDGKLRSKISQADLYLINPDGFIFGQNATLDLQGSLHISTASQLRLGETGRFETRHPQNSLLVSAPPSAFGFLNSKPASIEIRGSKLATQDGQTLSILGGQLDINGGRLTAVSGRINLAAVLEANQLKSTSSGLVVDANAQLGQITLKNNASINVGKLGAGDIYIRGGHFFLDNSKIIANTEVDKDSGMIVIDANELRLEKEAHINSRALGPGQGGQIIINVAGAATLSGESQISTSSLSTSASAGDAGNIFFEADKISLENSTISTTTSGPGQGGDIIIKAHQYINLIGAADFSTAIAASSEPKKDPANAGNAGRIFIRAKDLNLSGATSQIDNSTRGAGQGGSITLEIADRLRLNDGALISADSFGLGHAGSIYVNATTLEMEQGTISTAAETASGGNIIVNVRTWLNMKNSLLSATVSSGIGNGGNLAISNPRFLNLTGSQVIANASGGHGGLILIITDTPIEFYQSSITASSETGLAGEVKIDNIYNVDVSILPIDFMDASVLIKQQCAARTDTESSSFYVVGRGGLPNAPDDLQIYLPAP
jgi:filamentous hemagglutinin family protein